MTLSVDEAQSIIIDFCRTYPVAAQVSYKLRETQEELYGPQATREAVGGILGSFRPSRRQADFPTSNFRDADEFKETLRHEILGHFGINTFNPAEKRSVLDGIIAAQNEPGMSDLWNAVAQAYPEASDSLKAEEVFAFACEGIEPQTRAESIQGAKSFRETCIERSRPMQVTDLINITTMVAEGMRDRSRSQQNFPDSDHAQFKREQTMESKKPFHEIVAERLIEQLKQGTAPFQMPWKPGDGGGVMPFNPTTGKRYKGINAIHLMSQGRQDQRWMTYNQAKAQGAQVKKGEKSTPIQYWKFEEEQTKRDENNKPILDAKGDPVKERVRLERPKMFMANVFNAEQIDGLPEYQRPVQTWSAIERAETILQASQADIRHGGDNAYYRPSTDNIQLPNREQFPSASNYYATALHELGHWTGHGSRLDRDLSHPFGSEGYAKEELRAEIASMILGDELGIGHDPARHASYVQSWIKVLQNDPMEIFRAASDAEKIQTFVLGLEQTQIQTQHETNNLSDTLSTAVPVSWRGPACQVFDEEMASRLGEPNYGKAKELASFLSYYEEMSFEPSAQETKILEQKATDIKEAEVWIHENVLTNPIVKERMYETVRDLGRDTGDQASDKERHDYLAEMAANAALKASKEQGVSMAVPTQQPNIKAEEWALRAIERSDLDQVTRRMTSEQLDTFYGIVKSMQPLGNDNEFWTRREPAMESMLNDVDNMQNKIWRALEVIGDEEGRRIEVAKRTQAEEPLQEQARTPLFSSADQMVVTAAINVRMEQQPELKESFGRLLSMTSSQVLGYELPGDWMGTAQVVGIVKSADGVSVNQAKEGETPEFYGLYARSQQDDWAWLADYATESEAREQADRLHTINHYVRDAVESMELEVKPAQALDAQTAAEAPRAQETPKESREYLAVPYGEKEAAKAAGAKYDRTAKSWYVGPQGDREALARWKPENRAGELPPTLNVRDEFADAMRSVGLVVQGEHPIMDGKKHRVPVEGGRKGATDGFYVAYLDGHPAGAIINNKTGVDIKWKSKGYTLTDEQKAALQAEAANKLQAREAELLKTHEAVADKVTRQMDTLQPATEPTPYMVAKGIEPFSGVLTDKAGKETVIPALDVDGKQWTAQYIQKDGTKRFAKDGRKEGCFHPVGGLAAVAAAPVLVIAEGYATASTLASTLGHATVAAFDSGNLPAVAKALHQKFPDKPIVVAGDDDRHQVMTHGTNAGRTKALEAAKAVGGKAIFPTFAPGEAQYPEALPAITPQAYRKHTQAAAQLKELVSEKGPDAADPAKSAQAAELRAEMLSDEQTAALDRMKRLTDFNDLATKSALGKEGLERQVKNAVGRVIEQQENKVQQIRQEQVQGVARGSDEQQPKIRRAVKR